MAARETAGRLFVNLGGFPYFSLTRGNRSADTRRNRFDRRRLGERGPAASRPRAAAPRGADGHRGRGSALSFCRSYVFGLRPHRGPSEVSSGTHGFFVGPRELVRRRAVCSASPGSRIGRPLAPRRRLAGSSGWPAALRPAAAIRPQPAGRVRRSMRSPRAHASRPGLVAGHAGAGAESRRYCCRSIPHPTVVPARCAGPLGGARRPSPAAAAAAPPPRAAAVAIQPRRPPPSRRRGWVTGTTKNASFSAQR